jgi:hypothetical protein
MKSKILFLGVVVAAFTFTSFAVDALLSLRAQGNQSKIASGAANDSNPALDCRNGMAGSPKVVAECSAHTTRPGCQTVASAQ